ncbi:MAG: family 10 glycosylhydrolase [Prevotella sp.]|nr:family 10 glycosylhydrolase [Prevotella sp.]
MKKTRYLLTILLLLCTLGTVGSVVDPQKKHEVRAVWLTTIGGLDWPHTYNAERQRQELCDILDKLKAANINTVLLQTRVRATTIYPSDYEPYDGCITGTPGRQATYDPLAFAIEECHKRGMELHCWMVAIPIGRWNGYGCRQLRKKHPEMVKKIGDEGFMNPEKQATADYIADLCAEVASRYDIDGVHLDYIRYPETWKKIGNRNAARNNITRIVRTVHEKVKGIKKWIKISCSPIGKYDDVTRYNSNGWNAFSICCQDAQLWMQEGIVDMIFPMMYFRNNNFYPFALDWKENSNGRTVVPGLGIYFLSPSEKNWQLSDITREMEFARAQDMGFVMFRSKFFTDDTKGIYDFVKDQFCPYPALVPPMKWECSDTPDMPYGLETTVSETRTDLTWKGREGLLYNVYASMQKPVDISDARNLIATNMRNRSISVAKGNTQQSKTFFAVTSVDRFGNESKPIYSYDDRLTDTTNTSFKLTMFSVGDNGKLYLNENIKQIDIPYIIITNLNYQIIATRRIGNDMSIDISQLKEGTYMVRSVNKKGVSHRLGWFMKRLSD